MNEPGFTLSVIAALIFALPAFTFAVFALTQRRTKKIVDKAAVGVMAVCFGLAFYVFIRAWSWPSYLLLDVSFPWLPLTSAHSLSGGFMVDKLTAMMLVVVTLVSFLVFLFSAKYMHDDVRYGRYYCCLLLFSTSMLGLVLADNLLFLFAFWELVGLSSYLLIGHWFEKKSASSAAIKAFITTRIGDVGMLIGLMVIYAKTGSLHYADVFAAVSSGELSGHWQTIAGVGLFLGAMGKSAQFPLHVWLPDAMEGPTPVSALIHAATMVAAGVYLVGRMYPVFDAPALLFIAYIGAFTALFAATIALVQDDIKKVLAYSTVSQLGYMIMALGVGGYVSGLFHLTTHAFFKAGLFLGSGAVIYAMHHEQSLSKYGGLWKKMPKTALCYLLFTLALAGFPLFSGFWSKDAILADALAFAELKRHWFIPVAGFTTVFLTAFYMFRQYFLTFLGKPRDHHAYDHAHEVPWQMLFPLILLAVLSVGAGGFSGKWFGEFNPALSGEQQVQEFSQHGYRSEAVRLTMQRVERSTARGIAHDESGLKVVIHDPHDGQAEGDAHVESHHSSHEGGSAHEIAMILSVTLAFLGIALASLMYWEKKNGKTVLNPAALKAKVLPIFTLLWNKYYLDELNHLLIVKTTAAFSRFSAVFDRVVIDTIVNLFGALTKLSAFLIELADRILVDGVGVNGTARATGWVGDKLSLAQSGYLRQYLYVLLVGLITVSLICIWMV